MSATMQVVGGLGVFAAGTVAGYAAGTSELEALQVVIKAGVVIGGGAAVLGLCKKVQEAAKVAMKAMEELNYHTKVMKEELQGLKAQFEEKSDQAMEELKDLSREVKKEATVLKAQLKGHQDQTIEQLKGIYDRADKCGNKLEMLEYRVEGLVQQAPDTQRHLGQAMYEFRMELAGEQGVQVFDRWVEDTAQKWLQARGWLKDISQANFKCSWRKIWMGALEDSRAHAEALQKEADRVLEEEENIVQHNKLQAASQAIKANLEEHFKDSFWWIKDDVEPMWEEESRLVVYKALNNCK